MRYTKHSIQKNVQSHKSPKKPVLSNVRTKRLGRRRMDRFDKERLNSVPKNPVIRYKKITF